MVKSELPVLPYTLERTRLEAAEKTILNVKDTLLLSIQDEQFQGKPLYLKADFHIDNVKLGVLTLQSIFPSDALQEDGFTEEDIEEYKQLIKDQVRAIHLYRTQIQKIAHVILHPDNEELEAAKRLIIGVRRDNHDHTILTQPLVITFLVAPPSLRFRTIETIKPPKKEA